MLGNYESLHPTGAFGGVFFFFFVSSFLCPCFPWVTIQQLVGSLAGRVRNMGHLGSGACR